MKIFYVGIKGVIVNTLSKKVLVLSKTRNDGKRYWDLPGGRIDDQEAIDTTLDRELKEEILNIESYKVLDLLHAYRLPQDVDDGKNISLLLLFYKVESDLDVVHLSEEHDGYLWVGHDDLDTLKNEDIKIESGYLEAVKLALD